MELFSENALGEVPLRSLTAVVRINTGPAAHGNDAMEMVRACCRWHEGRMRRRAWRGSDRGVFSACEGSAMPRPQVWGAAVSGTCSRPAQVPLPSQWRAAESSTPGDSANWRGYFGERGLDTALEKALACSGSCGRQPRGFRAASQQRVIAGAADRPELGIGVNRLRQRRNFVGPPLLGFSGRVLSRTAWTCTAASRPPRDRAANI